MISKKANIGQIARELKARRGKGSRNTVREKVELLSELNVTKEVDSTKGKCYTLRKEVTNLI